MATKFKAYNAVRNLVENSNVGALEMFQRAILDAQYGCASGSLTQNGFIKDSDYNGFVIEITRDNSKALSLLRSALAGEYSDELAAFLVRFF